MKVDGIILNSFQANFVKELMGDVFMPDVRAEAMLTKICAKYSVSMADLVTTINKSFEKKNAEFKALEASFEKPASA